MEREWEFSYGRNDEFVSKMNELKYSMQETNDKIRALEEERLDLNSKKKVIQTMKEALESLPDALTRFSPKAFTDTVDYVEVSQYTLTYHFYGEECVKVNIELLKEMCK